MPTISEKIPSESVGGAAPAGSGFGRIARAELRKAVDTRTASTILVVMGVLTVGMVAVGVMTLQGGESWTGAHNQVASPAVTLLALPLILLVCEEWTKGTALVTFTQTPRRLRVLLAKVLIGAGFLVAGYCATLLLTGVAALLAQVVRGVDVVWDFSVVHQLHLGLPLAVNIGFGLAMALLTQETTIAMGLYFIVPPTTVVLTYLPGIGEAAKWVSLEHSSAFFAAGTSGVSAAQVSVSVLVWVVAPMVLGAWLATRKDIS